MGAVDVVEEWAAFHLPQAARWRKRLVKEADEALLVGRHVVSGGNEVREARPWRGQLGGAMKLRASVSHNSRLLLAIFEDAGHRCCRDCVLELTMSDHDGRLGLVRVLAIAVFLEMASLVATR